MCSEDHNFYKIFTQKLWKTVKSVIFGEKISFDMGKKKNNSAYLTKKEGKKKYWTFLPKQWSFEKIAVGVTVKARIG